VVKNWGIQGGLQVRSLTKAYSPLKILLFPEVFVFSCATKKIKFMKQLDILQATQNLTSLFAEQSREPVLVKNMTEQYFLVLPLDKMNMQEMFYRLYQLPENVFIQSQDKKISYDEIDAVCGSMKGLLSSSDEFAKNKQSEIDLEESKWKR